MRSEDLSYFEEEEFKEALAQYESALSEGRQVYMDADELTDIAEYYMVNEREPDATECINLAVQLHPDAIDPQVFLSRQQMFHGNMKAARRIAKAIDDQNDREVQFLWAEILIKEERQEEAYHRLQTYYETLEEDKDLFLYDAAGVFMDYDEWETATLWAKQLKKEFPKFKKTDILLSDIMVCCGKVSEAVTLLDDILSQEPFNKEAWNLMAEAQSGQEHYSEALEAIEYLLALDEKNEQAKLIRANCLFHLNRMAEAFLQYEDYLKRNPEDVSAIFFASVTLSNLGFYEDSYEMLSKAYELTTEDSPERSRIYLQYSFLASKTKGLREALDYLDKCYEAEGRKQDSDYFLLQGQYYLENGKPYMAEDLFQTALDMSDDQQTTKLMIAITFAENDEFETATDILEKLMDSDMPEKETRCLPYLAYCTHFIAIHPMRKVYFQQAMTYNPELTKSLFAIINPNKPLEEHEK